MFEKLNRPPKPGTPLESMMLMVWRMRQDLDLYRTRALVTAIVAAATKGEGSDKELQDAWKSYVEEVFPWQRGQRTNSDKAAIEYLKKEVARGPLHVMPLQSLSKPKSRMRRRHDAVTEERSAKRWRH